MSLPRVQIGSEEEDIAKTILVSMEVEQNLNQHWYCSLRLRDTVDARPDVEAQLGKPLKISTVSLDGSENVIFSGVVHSARLIYEVTGTFGVEIEAVSDTWKLDLKAGYGYFRSQTARAAAGEILDSKGFSLTGQMPDGKDLSYVQWNETDFTFLLRLVDDVEAWARPSVHDTTGVEIRTDFDQGPTLQWREGEYGLLEWSTYGSLQAFKQQGSHYDYEAMQSSYFSNEQSSVDFSGAQKMTSAVLQQGSNLPGVPATDRNRARTLPDYQQRLQRESRRAQACSVTCHGVSRDPRVRAGDTVTIAGHPEIDATYGVIGCRHRWTAKGYENTFFATPAKRWSPAIRPPRPHIGGLWPARVVENHDPLNQGRMRVQFWWQDQNQSTWIRLMTLYAGPDYGVMFFPEKGDEVLVAFEEGDPERPYIVGSAWNGVQKPPTEGFWDVGGENGEEFQQNDVKRIVTKSGHRISIADKPGKASIALATPTSTRILLTENANETGRPAVALYSAGDIILSAPNGRIHMNSAENSKQVG
jgi:type VI secretion system secreted protein VgrG